MKWLSAGLAFVNFATVFGLFLGMAGGGLGPWIALVSLLIGAAAAVAAYFTTAETRIDVQVPVSDQTTETLSKRAQRRLQRNAEARESVGAHTTYQSFWMWALAGCFAIFAARSFCWLLYIDGDELRIQSPNNLGDLALHITYIKNFANGVSIWPDNPIYVFSRLRYPAGTDLFNALLCCLHVDLTRGLIWSGLLASLATFYAFFRWSGAFGVAGFLFNGGLVGFQFFKDLMSGTVRFFDYQGDKAIAWKSIPLAMFVTQRGLLYAIPAGLLLLCHWREKFFRVPVQDRHRVGLPFWIELSLYASMPLFHLHTFIALSIVLVFLFVFGDTQTRKDTAILVGGSLLPATFFVWLITDHFHAGSVLAWKPDLLRKVPEFAAPFFHFWWINFGLWIPIALFLIGWCCWGAWKNGLRWGEKLPEDLCFLLPAVAIFLISVFVQLAPWGWDNLKILIWAYFLMLPILWTELIVKCTAPVRAGICVALFASGFVCLFGGLRLNDEKPGYGFANRGEIDSVGVAIRNLPVEARFAAFPIYNHPLLLQGRKLVLGYPGHVWTQDFHADGINAELTSLMRGEGDWQAAAKHLGVRYIFWGEEENMNYPGSKRPWAKSMNTVSSGKWGAIYDLESPRQPSTGP